MNVSEIDFEKIVDAIKKVTKLDYNDLVNIITKYGSCSDISTYEIIKILIDLEVVDKSIIPTLAGHKGTSFFDVGMVYAPYIPCIILDHA